MKISVRVYIISIINLYNIVYGKLVFEGCNKNGWKCGQLNNVDKYEIEYDCVVGNNSRAELFLWSFNAPNNTTGLKITNCEYLELDLSCGTDNEDINHVTIYDINILNITSSVNPDVSVFPAKLTIDQIKNIPHLPKFTQHASFPEGACNATSLELTSLVIKNIDKIETIKSYSIILSDMDTFLFDNVSITYIEPYAINVSMADFREVIMNDCYVEKIDVKGINFQAHDFVLNNSVVLDMEKSGICGSSYSFYMQDCLIGIVNPNALNILAKNVLFVKNTFGQLLPQAFYSISPDLSMETVNKNMLAYNYIFIDNKIYEANIGSLSPNWEMYQNVKLNFNFVRNFLPCSCEELGWLNLKSGIGNSLLNVIPFSKKIMKLKTKNSCIDSPCSLPLSVISLMRFRNGICDPNYDLELICITSKYKKTKNPLRKTSKKIFFEEDNENPLMDNSETSRSSIDTVSYPNLYYGGMKIKRHVRNKRKTYPRRRYAREDDFDKILIRKIRHNKQSKQTNGKKYQRKKQNKSRDSLVAKPIDKAKTEKPKKSTSFPDLHMLDEIHLEDGTNHESFEDENDYNVIKNEPKKTPPKKPQPKTKRFAKNVADDNLPPKPFKGKPQKTYMKSNQSPKNLSASNLTNPNEPNPKEVNHESTEYGDHLELDSSKIDVGEKFSTFEEMGEIDNKPKFPLKNNVNPKLDNPFKIKYNHEPDRKPLRIDHKQEMPDGHNHKTEDYAGVDNGGMDYSQRMDDDYNHRIEDNHIHRMEDARAHRVGDNYNPRTEDKHRNEDNHNPPMDDSRSHRMDDWNPRLEDNYNRRTKENYMRRMEDIRSPRIEVQNPRKNKPMMKNMIKIGNKYEVKNNVNNTIKNNSNRRLETHDPERELNANYEIGDNPNYGMEYNPRNEIKHNPSNQNIERKLNVGEGVNRIQQDKFNRGKKDKVVPKPEFKSYEEMDGKQSPESDSPLKMKFNSIIDQHEKNDDPIQIHQDFYEHQDHENGDNVNYFKNTVENENENSKNQNFVQKLMDLKNLLEINNINSNQKKNMLRTVFYKPFQQPNNISVIKTPYNKIKANMYNAKMDSSKSDTIRFEINDPDFDEPKKRVKYQRQQQPTSSKKKSSSNKRKSKSKTTKKKLPTKVIWLLNTKKYKWNRNQPIVLLPKIVAIPDSEEFDDDLNEEGNPYLKEHKYKTNKKPAKKNSTNLTPLKQSKNDGDEIYVQDMKQLYRGEEINLEKYLSTIYGNNSKTLSSKYKYKKFLPVTDTQKVFYNQDN